MLFKFVFGPSIIDRHAFLNNKASKYYPILLLPQIGGQ